MSKNNARNETGCFKKCRQLFESQHLLLVRDIWWSKLSIFKCCSFFQHHHYLDICGSLRQLFSCIGVKYELYYYLIFDRCSSEKKKFRTTPILLMQKANLTCNSESVTKFNSMIDTNMFHFYWIKWQLNGTACF